MIITGDRGGSAIGIVTNTNTQAKCESEEKLIKKPMTQPFLDVYFGLNWFSNQECITYGDKLEE